MIVLSCSGKLSGQECVVNVFLIAVKTNCIKQRAVYILLPPPGITLPQRVKQC